MVQGLWIAALMLVGGLAGLRKGWRWRAIDAGGCAAALALACWQYPRMVDYVQAISPALSATAGEGSAARQVALVYLFTALYGLLHVLLSLYVPDDKCPRARRWAAGLIGAIQAGTLTTLAITFLPYA